MEFPDLIKITLMFDIVAEEDDELNKDISLKKVKLAIILDSMGTLSIRIT